MYKDAGHVIAFQVSTRLRRHEFTTGEGEHLFSEAGPVKAVDVNKLRSNIPIEDSHTAGVADLGDRKAILFSVIDGHGGPTCGQVRRWTGLLLNRGDPPDLPSCGDPSIE